jgi:hypothetical protein
MGQKFFEDSIGTVSHAAGVITLSASRITLGGQQEAFNSLSYTISGLLASTKYNLFVVKSGGVLSLVPSTNAINVGPAGYTLFKFVRSFVTNGSASFGSFTSAVSDPNPVGTVVHSMLTLAQFQSIYGTTWVLADGGSATGSMYAAVTGSSTVPDMRGQFLRGKNNGRADGNQDPDGERLAGNLQGHQFASHNHGGSTAAQNLSRNFGAGTGAYAAGTHGTDTTRAEGSHAHTINAEGGNETRPRNVAVNIFIKINME